MKVAEVRPASVPGWVSIELDVEAPSLRPAREHAQEHLGPVLGVGASGTGVDLADRVALVVLPGEQRTQLQVIELVAQGHDPRFHLVLDRVVALFTTQLVKRLDVGEPFLEAFDELEVFAQAGHLGGEPTGTVLVVPEVGLPGLRLELVELGPRLVDVEVGSAPRRRVAPSAAQIVGEVTHAALLGLGIRRRFSDRGRA